MRESSELAHFSYLLLLVESPSGIADEETERPGCEEVPQISLLRWEICSADELLYLST